MSRELGLCHLRRHFSSGAYPKRTGRCFCDFTRQTTPGTRQIAMQTSEQSSSSPSLETSSNNMTFEYILEAALSPKTKVTYLDKDQPYTIRMQRLPGNQSENQDLWSIVTVLVNGQNDAKVMDIWRRSHPDKRILHVDTQKSENLEATNDDDDISQAYFKWNTSNRSSLSFEIHALSTDFPPQERSREGARLRVQIQTYRDSDRSELLHTVACQIKVYAEGGAQRQLKKEQPKTQTNENTSQPGNTRTYLREVDVLPQNEPDTEAFSRLSIGTQTGATASTTPTEEAASTSSPTSASPITEENRPDISRES